MSEVQQRVLKRQEAERLASSAEDKAGGGASSRASAGVDPTRGRATTAQKKRASAHFAVVDVETTGFSNQDRIVEVAVVTMDSAFAVVDEWQTLVNPLRGVGPTHIHGITSAMVATAPTFDQIYATLAQKLNGSVLVAHNLPFDLRFLTNEYRRLPASFDPGSGFCTYRATGKKLTDACAHYSIPLANHHRALDDARATARILSRVQVQQARDLSPVTIRLARG